MGEVEVLYGVHVLGATVDGASVHVDLYGGDDNVCGYVRFAFDDPVERAARVAVLRGWAARGTSVTFVSSGDTVTLLDRDADLGDDRVSRGSGTP
ncbi:MAG: hypothetical protein QOE93_185 [Actinomycetota bacterium]|nr:hypothetical protein [Actinomycetota bacterium]